MTPMEKLGSPVWFGPADQPLRGWLHEPLAANSPDARRIVIVPGFGYEELTSGWGLRILAEELANAGHTVLRYDHPGTGDSSGDEPTVQSWFDGVHHAVSALNFPDVTLLGVRLGATLALAAAADLAVSPCIAPIAKSPTGSDTPDFEIAPAAMAFGNGAITQIIAVSPVVSGRRMMRELTMLAATKKAVSTEPIGDIETGPLQLSWAAPSTAPTSQNGPLVVGGFDYPDKLRDGLSGLDLLALTESPAPRVEIVHAAERSTDKSFVSHLRTLGTAVYESSVIGIGKWLDTSSELAIAPQELIALVQDQLHGYSMGDSDALNNPIERHASLANTAEVRANGTVLREHGFRIGEPALSAVLTEPTTSTDHVPVAVLLLNSGVERSVGPGRAWVSWSRALAAKGHTVMRLDLSGVGNSGTWPGKPAFHNYGPETFDDVALGLEKLRAMGHQKVVIVGLCASSFAALGTAVHRNVVGIVAISPQFYRCGTPGSMAEPEDTNMSRHRISQIDQKINLRRKGAMIEELVGKQHQSTTWIEGWIAQRAKVRLVFGPDDRGLRFLQWRTPRALKRLSKNRLFTLQVHAELDHALHAAGPRADTFNDLCDFIDTL
jgi:pimeloyl-ACP methyl ester carboxylesterase